MDLNGLDTGYTLELAAMGRFNTIGLLSETINRTNFG